MAKLGFLGTGGAVATRDRDNTSFIISAGDAHVLVDCPGAAVQKIKKLNMESSQIDAVVITHIHPDHVYGLPAFVHSQMLEQREVPLYGSQETVEFCRRLLDIFGLMRDKIQYRFRFDVLEPGDVRNIFPGLEMEALSITHHSSSLAIRFTLHKASQILLYSGDTPAHDPFFKEAAGTDVLIHDCSAPRRYFQEFPELAAMHTDSLELGRMAEAAEIPHLIPCHFFGELEYTMDEIEREIRTHYTGNLIIPEDLEWISIPPE